MRRGGFFGVNPRIALLYLNAFQLHCSRFQLGNGVKIHIVGDGHRDIGFIHHVLHFLPNGEQLDGLLIAGILGNAEPVAQLIVELLGLGRGIRNLHIGTPVFYAPLLLLLCEAVEIVFKNPFFIFLD